MKVQRQKNDIVESEEVIELLFDSDISDSEISFSSSNEEEVFSSENENDASCLTMTWEKIDESYRPHTYHKIPLCMDCFPIYHTQDKY